MRRVDWSTKFKKDYKRELKGRYSKDLLEELNKIIFTLALDNQLPPKYKDHALICNWKACRDCHVFYDLVLIYQYQENNVLRLVRLGSHSELNLA